jgi:2-(1,2-epoxy-1,2-dihydrophenyl)acetyl-CoA isomerase
MAPPPATAVDDRAADASAEASVGFRGRSDAVNEEPILLAMADGVATITLNRPDKLNAFNGAMHAALRAALDTIAAAPAVRALVLTGAGRGFCAGQDLGARPAADADLGDSLERHYNVLIRRLRAMPLPLVVAVNGVAAGAGASLALAGDIVLAARSASFIQAFCRIGLMPDAGGTWVLPRLAGPARAAGLALLGEALPAETAAAWGLIWRVVDDERLPQEAAALGARLAQQPTRALAAIKQALQASWAHTLDQQLDLERDLQRELGWTEDYREGVAAFREKRPARFQGR